MNVHNVETPNTMGPRQVAYGGWVRPAWMWSCILGCLVATTATALVSVVASVLWLSTDPAVIKSRVSSWWR